MSPLYPKPARTRKSQVEPTRIPNLRAKKDGEISGVQVKTVLHLAASAEMSSGLSLEGVRSSGRLVVRAFGTHSMSACKSCCHAAGNLN